MTEYRAVLAVIESMTGRERADEELSTVVQLRRALVEILAETSIRRVVLLEGDSGLGKSSALHLLKRRYGQRILVIEATAVWGDSANSFLAAILDALGVREQPAYAAARPSCASTAWPWPSMRRTTSGPSA